MMENIQKLIHLYLDGEASTKEKELISETIKNNAEAASMFAQAVRFHSLLREIENEEFSDLTQEAFTPKKSPFRNMILVPAASILVAASVVLFMILFSGVTPGDGGTLISGDLTSVIERDGERISVDGESSVKIGDTVETGSGTADQKVTLQLEDASRMVLGPKTKITVAKNNRYLLHTGSVSCLVQKQNREFSVKAVPVNADVRVLGTEFTVELKDVKEKEMNKLMKAALITVLSGVVSVTPAGGDEVRVEAGNAVLVGEDGSVSKEEGLYKVEVLAYDTRVRGTYIVDFKVTRPNETGERILIADPGIKLENGKPGTMNIGSGDGFIYYTAEIVEENGQYYAETTVTIKKDTPEEFITEQTVPVRIDWPLTDTPSERMQKLLDQTASFDFTDVSISQVRQIIRHIAGISLRVDPKAVDKEVTLKVDKMKLRNIIFWVTRLAGAEVGLENGEVAIREKGAMPDPWPLHYADEEKNAWYNILQKKMEAKITFDFVETPLGECLDFLETVSGISFITDSSVDIHSPVTLKVDTMRLDISLGWITRLKDIQYTIAREAVYISNDKNIDFEGAPEKRKAYLEELRRKEEERQRKAIAAVEKVRSALSSKRISVDFMDTPIEQAAQFLAKMTEVPLVLDPAVLVDDRGTPVSRNVTLKVADMTAENVLFWATYLTGTRIAYRDEAVFIQKDVFRKPGVLPLELREGSDPAAEKAIRKKLTMNITWSSENTKLHDIGRKLSLLTGVNIVVDPKIGEHMVSFGKKDVTMQGILDLISYLPDIDYTVGCEAVLIYKSTEKTGKSDITMTKKETITKMTVDKYLTTTVLAAKPETDGDVKFVMLGGGSDHGIKVGFKYAIFRGDTYIANVSVRKVFKGSCMAEVIPESVGRDDVGQKYEVRQGDTAFHRDPTNKKIMKEMQERIKKKKAGQPLGI